MKYKFDKSLRWFKEIPKYDKEIAKWSAYKFWIMQECIALSLRFGNPFHITLTDFGIHIRVERHAIGRYLTQLSKEGWISYTAGVYTNRSAEISVDWVKLNSLYETHETEFKTMEKEQKSGKPFTAVNQENGIGNTAVSKTESGTIKHECGTIRHECGIGSANNKNDKENDKENGKIVLDKQAQDLIDKVNKNIKADKNKADCKTV